MGAGGANALRDGHNRPVAQAHGQAGKVSGGDGNGRTTPFRYQTDSGAGMLPAFKVLVLNALLPGNVVVLA